MWHHGRHTKKPLNFISCCSESLCNTNELRVSTHTHTHTVHVNPTHPDGPALRPAVYQWNQEMSSGCSLQLITHTWRQRSVYAADDLNLRPHESASFTPVDVFAMIVVFSVEGVWSSFEDVFFLLFSIA